MKYPKKRINIRTKIHRIILEEMLSDFADEDKAVKIVKAPPGFLAYMASARIVELIQNNYRRRKR